MSQIQQISLDQTQMSTLNKMVEQDNTNTIIILTKL